MKVNKQNKTRKISAIISMMMVCILLLSNIHPANTLSTQHHSLKLVHAEVYHPTDLVDLYIHSFAVFEGKVIRKYEEDRYLNGVKMKISFSEVMVENRIKNMDNNTWFYDEESTLDQMKFIQVQNNETNILGENYSFGPKTEIGSSYVFYVDAPQVLLDRNGKEQTSVKSIAFYDMKTLHAYADKMIQNGKDIGMFLTKKDRDYELQLYRNSPGLWSPALMYMFVARNIILQMPVDNTHDNQGNEIISIEQLRGNLDQDTSINFEVSVNDEFYQFPSVPIDAIKRIAQHTQWVAEVEFDGNRMYSLSNSEKNGPIGDLSSSQQNRYKSEVIVKNVFNGIPFQPNQKIKILEDGIAIDSALTNGNRSFYTNGTALMKEHHRYLVFLTYDPTENVYRLADPRLGKLPIALDPFIYTINLGSSFVSVDDFNHADVFLSDNQVEVYQKIHQLLMKKYFPILK